MQCDRCGADGARFPRPGQDRTDFLCSACLVDARGLTTKLLNRSKRYQKLVAEAKADFEAWDTRFLAALEEKRKARRVRG